MKRTFELFLGIGVAVAVVVTLIPAAHGAPCLPAREFGAQGNASLTGRIIIDTTTHGYPNDGNEIQSLWDAVNGSGSFSANGANGGHVPAPTDVCDEALNDWYKTGTMLLGANSGIQGFIGTTNCGNLNCPIGGEEISVLVEDSNGSNAGFILYTVDGTPAGIRFYDHARTAGIDGAGGATATQVFENYPTVDVIGSAGPPPNTTVTSNYLDLALNYHGADATAAASSGVQSYDIVAHHGPSSPGRNRAAYNLGVIKQIPYGDSGENGDAVDVPCPTEVDDTFLAVGATFVDPSTGGLASVFVGDDTAVECDPNIADPDGPRIQRQRRLGRAGR